MSENHHHHPQRKPINNGLHRDSNGIIRGNRWLSSESAVEFSTKQSVTDSWVNPKGGLTTRNLLPPMRDAKTGKNKFISASFTAGEQEYPDIRQLRAQQGRRRSSVKNNQRVVSHLRRRLRQRLSDAFLDDYPSDEEDNEDDAGDGTKTPRKLTRRDNIFSQYNDIGGRLSKDGLVTNGVPPQGTHLKDLKDVSAAVTGSTVPSPRIAFKTPVPSRNPSAKDDIKSIYSNKSSSSNASNNGDPSNSNNVVVTVDANELTTDDGIGSSERNVEGNSLGVNRQLSSTSAKSSLQLDDSLASPRRLSNTSSVKSLHLEDSSSLPLLPKIDVSRSPSQTSSSTSHHTPMSPDFKLPIIKDGRRRSLVSPVGDVKSSADETDSKMNGDAIKSSSIEEQSDNSTTLVQNADIPAASDQSLEPDEQNDPTSDEDTQLEEDEGKDEYGEDEEEQMETKGFDLDKEVSPVPTPKPGSPNPYIMECTTQVVSKREQVDLKAWAEQIYQGCLDRRWPIPSKIIRVYISSSFLDFEEERTALVAKCYPRLRALCRKRGYEFQVCDMRWGLYDTVVDNHSFAKLCLKQLKSCQAESTALNFVSFIGHRYGGRGLPASVPVGVFEAVLETLSKEKEKLIERKKRPKRIFISETSILGEHIPERKLSDHRTPISLQKVNGSTDEKTSQKATATGTKVKDGRKPHGSKRKKSFLTTVNKMVTTIRLMDLGRKRNSKDFVVDNNTATADIPEDEISETESEKLMDDKQVEKEFETNISLLHTWFKLDQNAVPPVYQLQHISCEFREILSNDKVKKTRARNQWLGVQKRLHKIFKKYLKKALKTEEQHYIEGFTMSVTEKELDKGILSTDGDLHFKALCYRRNISDLKSNLQDYAARNYIDLHNLKPEIDAVRLLKIEEMKKTKIPDRLPFTNIVDLSVAWFKEGINPHNRPHSIYLDRLANDFSDVAKNKIEKCLDGISKGQANMADRDYLCEDIAQHLNLVYERCESFYGRADTLTHIKKYLLSDSNQPLVLYGPPGCGKTSIMAKTAQLTRQWMKRDDVAIVIRCIGHTLPSVNIRTLTRQLCQQLCHIYDMEITSVPQDYFGVLNDFSGRLSAASSDKPLVIFLDGLDQLTTEPSSQSILTWLPKQLPDNVHMVISTSTTDGDTFKALKKLLGPGNNLLEVPNLTDGESQFILDDIMLHSGRTITQAQREVIMTVVEENPTPLYVQMVAQEALLWQSGFEERQLFLPNTLDKLINSIFVRMETTQGEPFVRRALGYITAAQGGVTWTELEDLLSLDDAVMSDIATHHGTAVRRLPPALWCRLRSDLEPYLSVGLVDNVQTYRWCHRQFHQVASDRYLMQRDKAVSYHSAFVDYFVGKWAGGVKKPCQGSKTGEDRLVDEQPLMWNIGGANHVRYNLRKLNELPYHLLQANQPDLLKSQTLFNYEFMLAKLKAMSLYSILDDLQRALSVQPNNMELRLMSDTLQLSTDGLTKDSNQLATQLIGRLQNVIANDQPMVIGDTKKYPMLSMMVAQAHKSSVPTLIPSKTCLAPPGGVLNDLLAGHTKVITAVAAASSGATAATASLDGTIKLWDLCNRKVIKTIQVETYKITNICFLVRNLYLASITSTNHILVWNIRKGTQILTIDQYIDPPIVTVAGADEQYLVAFFSGSNVMRTWGIGQECVLVKEFAIISTRGIHKDESVCVSLRANADKVLYAFRSDNRAYVTDATTGQRVHELTVPGEAAAVTALSMSHDYYIVACRYQYMQLSEIHHLELFDIKLGTHLRSIRGCTQDSVNELYVNKMGSHALCLSPSAKSNTTHIAVWNLETDNHKHLAKHPQISSMGACTNLDYCISASRQDKVLRIWNLSKKVNDREASKPIGTAKSNKSSGGGKNEGIVQIVPMENNPRYVVAKSVNNGPVTVWNIVKGKCASSPVRIERGLVDSHDIVLARNHHLVVLSDKGISRVSDRPLQVFQTVYVYNLKTKKYIRKLTGVFIIPSPAHEYKLLDGELLLGLSESRDHLIVWSLENGHIKYRIKNSFKELWRGLTKEDEEARMRPKRDTTARMAPWDRRQETRTARGRRREVEISEEKKRLDDVNMEKENTIEQYMMSQDEKVIVCSYFAHHLCVFDVATQAHTHTLENHNSMLHLYNAAMTPTGSHLVHVNYDEYEKFSYVTLWDLKSGTIRKRIRNEPNVCCIGVNPDATRVFFGNERNILKIWDVQRDGTSTLRKLKGYPGMQLGMSSKIFIIQGGVRAMVCANDISIWDLDNATRLATFSPDIRVTDIHVVQNSQLIVLAVRDNADVITLRLKGRGIEVDQMDLTPSGVELFGETTGDSSDEDDEEGNEEKHETGDNNSIKSDNN